MKREVDVARPVIAFLLEDGWDVYQEVSYAYSSIRADIAARRGNVIWVIETKTSLTLSLLQQANKWRGLANMVSIAVPSANRGTERFVESICEWLGVGKITVDDSSLVRIDQRARLSRRRSEALERSLCDEQKIDGGYADAGSAGGGYFTPFAKTVRAVTEYLRRNPCVTSKELFRNIDHHYVSYESARGALLAWARSGKIPGVTVKGHGRELMIHYEKPERYLDQKDDE